MDRGVHGYSPWGQIFDMTELAHRTAQTQKTVTDQSLGFLGIEDVFEASAKPGPHLGFWASLCCPEPETES